ncbi:MAG: ATP-grasp domain-containing protein [Burkholderiales bacterium]
MSDPVPVMVTGVGGGGHGEQIVKALRLGKLRYRIIGTDIDRYCSGFSEVDISCQVPRASAPGYMETILALCKQHGVKALFHGSEAEMVTFDAQRARIESMGVYLPVNREHVLKACQNKVSTMKFLQAHGFPAPQSREIVSGEDLANYNEFPAVLKPAIGGGGSANVYIVQDRQELELFAQHLLKTSTPVLLQQYVGSPDAEFTVGVLFGSDGALLNSIAIRRVIGNAISVRLRVPNRTSNHTLGNSLVISSGVSQGEVGRWPLVTAQCERIARALKPNAPVNIQCRLVNDIVIPFEINPRFSGTTSLRAMAGYNEPDVLIRRDVFGEAIENQFPYEECVIMRGLSEVKVNTAPH